MKRDKMMKIVAISVIFAVMITPTLASSPVVEVDDGQVHAIGETAPINITLSKAPNGLSGYNISISLFNMSVAEIISVSFPDWATIHSNSSLPADSFWIKAADLNDQIKIDERNITLASLTVRGDDYGDDEITASVTKMDDDNGNPINPFVESGIFDPTSLIYFNPQTPKTDIGSKETVNLTLNNAPGLSGYNLTVSLSNPEIAEIVDVDFPEWATLNDNSSLPADSLWIKCVDLKDEVGTGASINLGTLTVRGDSPGTTDITATITKMDDDNGNPINPSTTPGHLEVGISYFDTGNGAYPSIMGTHKGMIKPNKTIEVHKLYTYPCAGTGGHTESIELYENGVLIASGTWSGYQDDWHNITITPSVTLLKDHEYNYTLRTGSYPQIIHESSREVTGGTINCTSFIDTNGKEYTDWIPAIRLE